MSKNSNLIKSYAKVNLGLKILDLLPDNYHSIFTIMQEINLYDTIQIYKNNTSKLRIDCQGSIPVPNNDDNLCIKAAKLIFNNYNINHGLDISLVKNIPTSAGLGGGSSNAAAILCALNDIFELNINNNELHELAFELGCDIPFFINGGIQISEGKGEKLTKLNLDLTNYNILLVYPNFNVSTKWAYSFFKNNLSKTFDCDKFRSFQDGLDWELFENDFENIIKLTYPEVVEIRKILKTQSSLFISLSGSGSTMFGVFEDFLKADIAYHQLKTYHCHIVKPIKRN
jgi:4-diphosphocytidyl-2-C-methyl-D-erythritol kinase